MHLMRAPCFIFIWYIDLHIPGADGAILCCFLFFYHFLAIRLIWFFRFLVDNANAIARFFDFFMGVPFFLLVGFLQLCSAAPMIQHTTTIELLKIIPRSFFRFPPLLVLSVSPFSPGRLYQTLMGKDLKRNKKIRADPTRNRLFSFFFLKSTKRSDIGYPLTLCSLLVDNKINPNIEVGPKWTKFNYLTKWKREKRFIFFNETPPQSLLI